MSSGRRVASARLVGPRPDCDRAMRENIITPRGETPLDPFLRKLGIEWPIIQAPMAGVDTPEMAAAVSNAGGLGSVGVGPGTSGISITVGCWRVSRANELLTHWAAHITNTSRRQ
jgi:hypothetical protein